MLPHPFEKLDLKMQRLVSCNLGGSIFRQGDQTRGMYYLQSGDVELVRYSKSGDAVIIHRAQAGQTFAEASLFSNEYHCDAIARSDVKLIELNKSSILAQMATDSDFALSLTARFAQQVQAYRQRLEILAIRAADKRVYAAIVAGLMTSDIRSLAGEIGLTSEATYRALRQLVDRGVLIKAGRGKYVLPVADDGLKDLA